jgi:superfamily I DNA and/or RNA helicase
MPNVQEIFDRIQKTKKEQKEIKDMYRDALSNSKLLQEVSEELKTLKEKKKGIEDSIRADFNAEFEKLETLKSDIENDSMLLSDAALTMAMKGEMIEIKDQYDNKYEPIFRVQFKKAN